ncbi:hypothetical protein [Serratia sp. (in: enterobacteria)]|uniref:hypothetical protein n=1 Tax=Serratia sp. (in: enterobacteria) TaxID=616 RepID=UPI0039892A9E
MKTPNQQENYIYLTVNYWIVTVLCGVFLGLLRLAWLKDWGGAYRLSYSGLFAIAAFYAIELYFKKEALS